MNKEQNKENKKLPGFYIAVCCCVLAIGAAGYFTRKEEAKRASIAVNDIVDEETPEASLPVSTSMPTKIPVAEEIISPTMLPQKPSVTEAVQAAAAPAAIVESYENDNPDIEASITVAAQDNISFAMPTVGEILSQYSEKPIYNTALNDWRTHDGVDIAVNEGGSVCAAADGTISEVGENVMGCYVVISHSEGYVTKYMQMESAGEAKEGANVLKGDVIGVIGKSKAETTTEPHLHFEIYKDGTCLNPAEVIK